MKKLFLLFVIGIQVQYGFSQKFNKSDLALCFYLVNIDDNFGVPYNKANWDSIYKEVVLVLADSAGLTIKPVDYLKDDVAYSFTGYPLVKGKKAAKSHKAENYIYIAVDIGAAGIQSSSSSSVGMGNVVSKSKKSTKTKVKVKVSISIYDKTGLEVVDLKESTVSKNEILIESESLNFTTISLSETTFKENQTNNQVFQHLLKEAVLKLSKQLK